jgi:WD40 repeat protein
MAGRRFVLSMAVSFDEGVDSLANLDFAPGLRGSLLEVLTSAPFGYEEVQVPREGSLPAVTLGRWVADTIHGRQADDVLIVHVISHGYAEEGKEAVVYVVGSDGKHDTETKVTNWLDKVRNRGDGAAQTLFLLDFCYSGNQPALDPNLRDSASSRRAWLICASQPADLAYDGRLTRAVTDVLQHVGESGLASASQEFVPLDMVTRLIRQSVDRLSAGTDFAQQVTATLVDMSAPQAVGRFFPNRFYDESKARWERERDALRQQVGTDVTHFIDKLFDAEHFISRAQARGPRQQFDLSGYFYGRRRELMRLRNWAVKGDGGAFQVVTGSPGAGKSALLGMLVCGIHPKLRPYTGHFRGDRYRDVLDAAVDALVAVHARQRDTREIRASIASQLGLAGRDGQWTEQALIDALSQLAAPPVIVIDALDEALDLGELVEFLLALAGSAGRGEGPACRLLAGTRTRAEIEPLLDVVRDGGDEPIDLDTVDPAELRADLALYVRALLDDSTLYESAEGARVRGAVADRMAEALTGRPQRATGWGAFLVALLCAKQLTSLRRLPDPDTLRMPADLPEVFDQDISASHYTEWLRPVLTSIAYARQDGMPAEVIRVVAEAFHPDGRQPTRNDVTTALRDARFYLRQGVEQDGTPLFRLFHQGLADHLRSAHQDGGGPGRPVGLGQDDRADGDAAIVDHIIAYVRSPGGDWEHVTPYMLRDIVDHARIGNRLDELVADFDFLVNAWPRWLSPFLTYQSQQTRECVGVYMTSFARHRALEPSRRRQILAIDAARRGMREMAGKLAAPLPWRPRWATGDDLPPAPRTLAGDLSASAIACACLRDGTIVAVTTGKDVRVWDLGAGGLLLPPLAVPDGWVHAVACATLRDGTPVAVTAGKDVRVWDLSAGGLLHPPLAVPDGWVHAVACTKLRDGTPVAVTAGQDVLVWNLETGVPVQTSLAVPDGWVGAVACTTFDDGTPIVVTSGANRVVRTWSLDDGQPLGKPLSGHDGWVGAVACTVLRDGTPICLTGGDDGTVRMWDLGSGEPHGPPLSGHDGWVHTVACSTLPDGTRIALTAGNDLTVLVWDLDRAKPHQDPLTGHTSWIKAMTCVTPADGVPIAATCSEDRTIRLWDVAPEAQSSRPEPPGAIRRILLADAPDGTRVAIASDGETPRAWDTATGEPHVLAGFGGPGPVGEQQVTLRTGPTVTVTGGDAVYVRYLTNGELYMDRLTGHTGIVHVACGVLTDGTPVAVSAGSQDRTARIWQLETGQPYGEPLVGHADEISAVACGIGRNGQPIAVTGGNTGTLRLWELATSKPLLSADLPACAGAVAVDRDGTVFAAIRGDIVCLEFPRKEGEQ